VPSRDSGEVSAPTRALRDLADRPGDNHPMSDPDDELESGAADRLIFFSDAVVAIAITLLALELPVPVGKTTHEFWQSARSYDGHYLAFLISFIVIAAAWSQHHHVMRYAERSDSRLRTCNMLWLLTIILNPFATKLLTTEGHDSLATHALRFGFYALLEVLASAAFVALVHHMMSSGLASPGTPRRIPDGAYWQGAGVIVGFGLSIPLFFVTSHAWVLWILGPLLIGRLARRWRRPGEQGSPGRIPA
jgi:uncharacterized membrane protein